MGMSIKKISELSGVSVATVSRVINKKGKYSKATEEKVLKIIQDHHYIPNLVARGLRTKVSAIIGIIVPDITNEYFAKIVLSIQKELFAQNYSAIICNTNEQSLLEKQHLDFLLAQNVSGMIMVGHPGNEFTKKNIPNIYIDRKPQRFDDNYTLIMSDNIQGGYLAGKELLRKGCQQIAAIMDMRKLALGQDRYQGFCKALSEQGIQHDADLLYHIETVDFQNGERAMQKLLQSKPHIDGVFCSTDWVALGAIKALQANRLRIPEDVKVVGFDNISIAELAQTPLTTIHQHTEQMAREAVQALMQLIHKNSVDFTIKKLPVKLIPRATT